MKSDFRFILFTLTTKQIFAHSPVSTFQIDLLSVDKDEAGAQLQVRLERSFNDCPIGFFLSNSHRERWQHWRVRCYRMSGRNLAALFLLTAYEDTEMAEYGFLTKYIFADGIEEIDINSWRDIEIQYSDGRTVKLEEHFDSPDHAANVIRRMLQNSGKVLDNASPDRKSTRLNSSHSDRSRMPSSA